MIAKPLNTENCLTTMSKTEVVTLTLFEFQGFRNKWKAFQNMGRSNQLLPQLKIPSFAKMLGSGAKTGFSHLPNLGVYALLAVWPKEETAEQFFKNNSWFKACVHASSNVFTIYMQTCGVHGKWEGNTPFKKTINQLADRPLAVLTRATIRPSRLLRFWQFVSPVSQFLHQSQNKIFAVGVGELPLIQQATFSIWENIKALETFAYHSGLHSKVVQLTRKEKWYQEDLFARFHPYKTKGHWNNLNLNLS